MLTYMCLCRKMQDHIDFLCCEKQLHEVGIAYVALYESEHENTKLHCACTFIRTLLLQEQQRKTVREELILPSPV